VPAHFLPARPTCPPARPTCPPLAGRDDVADTNFLEWLRDTVYEAVKIAERHESLKLRIREARANIEHRYQLASLQVRAATHTCQQQQQQQQPGVRRPQQQYVGTGQRHTRARKLTRHRRSVGCVCAGWL
jgi:hypothetical protein